jgi:hypothetical protein
MVERAKSKTKETVTWGKQIDITSTDKKSEVLDLIGNAVLSYNKSICGCDTPKTPNLPTSDVASIKFWNGVRKDSNLFFCGLSITSLTGKKDTEKGQNITLSFNLNPTSGEWSRATAIKFLFNDNDGSQFRILGSDSKRLIAILCDSCSNQESKAILEKINNLIQE